MKYKRFLNQRSIFGTGKIACHLLFAVLFGLFWTTQGAAQANWRNVNMGWETSCNPDRGAISRTRKLITFRTSSNNCQGGIFNQRAELHSKFISVNRQVTYMFESTVSMQTESNEGFIFFPDT